mmetsp:Transcript_73359/g.153124  ORF Transcript_73359/g.153124 Transcript_73359/m.153124 type:complete len:218 (-) Transcript_73359:97-750(-)
MVFFSSRTSFLVVLVCLGLFDSFKQTQGFSFDLYVTKQKCFTEEDLDFGVLVVGDFKVAEPRPGNPKMPIHIHVKDPKGDVVYERKNIYEGRFALTTEVEGDYTVCFQNMGPSRYRIPRRITLVLKTGFEAQDYSDALNVEDLSAVDRNLRKTYELTNKIVHDFKLAKKSEAEMRDLSEHTCSRVVWFAFFTIIVLLATGVFEMRWLENYMRRQKII